MKDIDKKNLHSSVMSSVTLGSVGSYIDDDESDGTSNNNSSDDDNLLTDADHFHESLRFLDATVLKGFLGEDEVLVDDMDTKDDDDNKNEKDVKCDAQENAMVKEAIREVDELHDKFNPPAPAKQRRRSSLLKKTLQKTFDSQEERTVLKVLAQIHQIEEKQHHQGFKEINFTGGVLNCLLVAYWFGSHPEHFWLIYLIESLYFIPRKFGNMLRAKPLNQALYYFDFCWMMNFNIITCLLVLVSPIPIPSPVRRSLYRAAFGIACGPLLGATAILPFVAFVFHDINSMTNVIIHALPPMMLYTIRWHVNDIRQAWPTIFSETVRSALEEVPFFPPDQGILFVPGTALDTIAGNAVLVYFLWWIPYTSWMVLMGLDLPRKNKPGHTPKYDTVFHSFWRAGAAQTFGRIFWKRPVAISQQQMRDDHYEVRDFLLYMTFHGIAALISIPTLAFACNAGKQWHMGLILLVVVLCIHRGSQRYTYYTTKMYSRLIQKEFLSSPMSAAAAAAQK